MNKLQILITLAVVLIVAHVTSGELSAQDQQQDPMLVSNNEKEAMLLGNIDQVPLTDLLLRLENKFGVTFLYDHTTVVNKFLSRKEASLGKNPGENLSRILLELGLSYEEIHEDIYLLLPQMSPLNRAYVFQTVSGRVTDASTGESLPGVNVVVKGTTTGTATNTDGEYELTVESLQDTLVFSFIGYQTQEVPINGRTEIDIAMQSELVRGEELVVVGYGVQRRSDITGSVGVVSGEDLEERSSFNALESLRGKVPGVSIFTNSGSPTGSNRVIIRGVGTINASSDPLYVVDGVVMENIEFMNPNNIESIEVLKDATSTAIYGSRGANGVILITTARGIDDGIIVGYEGDLSIGRLAKKMDVLNAEEFMEVQRIGRENVPHFSPGSEVPELDLSDPRLFDAQGNPLYDTDWQEEATRTAFSNNHQFSVQYGGDRSSIGAFLNYTNQQGIFLNSYMDRISLKLVYDANPTEWLSVGTNFTISDVSENNVEEGGGGTTARRTIIEFPPIFPVKWEDGTYPDATQAEGFSFEAQTNPVHILLESDRLRDRIILFGNTFASFQLAPTLEFRTQLGIENTIFESRNYCPVGMFSCGGSPDGDAGITNSKTLYWQNENFLTYLEDFGPHRINSVLGASWQKRNYRANWMSAEGFSDDFFRYNNIGTATNPDPPGSDANDWTMSSYFTRTSYTYADTYSATFTARVDGSSRFGANSKYGFFPSAGVAWIATNGDFMSGLSFIDYLKLRMSYGVTGNTEIGLYRSLATIGSGTTLLGGDRQPVSFVQRLPNPDLEWEKTSQFNIGLELDLFNEVVSLEADWYYKLTDDLLLDRPVPMTTGFSTITDNIGSVSNRGIDFLITTRNVRSSDFFWSTTLNFNYNKNRVESLGVEDEDIFPGPFWVSGSQTILRVGEPIGSFWGFERLGTWSTDEAEEAAAVGHLPGEAKRSDQQKIIGNGLPDFRGSFINQFNFGNFDAIIDLQFSYGADIMQQFLHSSEDRMGLTSGLSTQLHDSWTPDNQNTMVQRIRHFSFNGQSSQADSHWIVDGSYIRGNLFSIGYTFDQSTIAPLGLSQLRLNVSLENAFVIHHPDFKGFDPEATSWGGNLHAQNIFFYQYPKARTFSLGVDVRF